MVVFMTKNSSETYWENYYKSGVAPADPSNFASLVVAKHVEVGQSLIELGCGNGRDAHFFADSGLEVVAVDQCAEEIEELAKAHGHYSNLDYRADDFTRLPDSETKFDAIYSRFTLHSVNAEGQQRTLDWCARNIADLGRLCIETRGQKNELYERGEPVEGEENAFVYEDHYRRFVDFDTFTGDIEATGFTIVDASEATGYAPFRDTDYHFIRVIAEK
jgi:ubiquinone/menaquinone biosynthesis C-methylase UbiE